MNTNRYNRDKFEKKIIALKTEHDRYDCLRLLTSQNKHVQLCHNTYDEKHMNAIIDNSDYVILHHYKHRIQDIVGFALVKKRNHNMEILLLCTIPNKEDYGRMVAFSVNNFAIIKTCEKIYAAPRTASLRTTFIKYGFIPFYGTQDIDEVLEKSINTPRFTKVNKTRKLHKPMIISSLNSKQYEELYV